MSTPIDTTEHSNPTPPIYVPMILHKNKEIWRAIRRYGDSIEEEYSNRYTKGFVLGFLSGFSVASIAFCIFLDRLAQKRGRFLGF
jgi:hypothetical protein